MILEQLKTLVSSVDSYLDKNISASELEQFTLRVIGDDGFESLGAEVQDVIYALDSKELNALDVQEIIQLRDQLMAYIQSNSSEDSRK